MFLPLLAPCTFPPGGGGGDGEIQKHTVESTVTCKKNSSHQSWHFSWAAWSSLFWKGVLVWLTSLHSQIEANYIDSLHLLWQWVQTLYRRFFAPSQMHVVICLNHIYNASWNKCKLIWNPRGWLSWQFQNQLSISWECFSSRGYNISKSVGTWPIVTYMCGYMYSCTPSVLRVL